MDVGYCLRHKNYIKNTLQTKPPDYSGCPDLQPEPNIFLLTILPRFHKNRDGKPKLRSQRRLFSTVCLTVHPHRYCFDLGLLQEFQAYLLVLAFPQSRYLELHHQ